MSLMGKLSAIWAGSDEPFLIHRTGPIRFSDLAAHDATALAGIKPGDVVAIIGDIDPQSIVTLLRLIELKAIVVPLTRDTANDHEYFFETAQVDWVIEGGAAKRRPATGANDLLQSIRSKGHAGLVLFSTGTTGRPKGILHDLTQFLARFDTPRPTLRTLNFLLFDHIGGINTLFHTLFNKGVVIAPEARTVASIFATCRAHNVELLPTTPTFLRMVLMSGQLPGLVPQSLRLITYGTELMDQPTLDELGRLLPQIDFRQTYGMSELGILRVQSVNRSSLYMKVGGEGVETRVVDGVLQIRSQSRMLGYLNAPSPFDAQGWYDTKDVVEVAGEAFRIVGRTTDVINVGGLKFMASEVERLALEYPGIELVSAYARSNPITGQHVELKVQPVHGATFDSQKFTAYLKASLPAHMVPRRIRVEDVSVGHRFKRR